MPKDLVHPHESCMCVPHQDFCHVSEDLHSPNIYRREISGHKQVLKALLESEEKYRVLVENASEGIFVIQDGTIQYANPELEKISGYPKEELLNQPFTNYIHPEDRDEVVERHRRRMRGEKPPAVYTSRLVDVHGNTKWVEANVALIPWKGRPAALIFLVDVTERKRVEEALQERQARLDSIFRVAPIGIGIVIRRVLMEVNDRICEITGYSREELLGRSSRILYPTQHEFDFVGTDKARQYRERGLGCLETRCRHKDGHLIDILLGSTPIVPGHPEAGVIFTALDISDRKKAEKELRDSEERFRDITENLPGVVFQFFARDTGEMGFYYVSEKASEVLGIDNADGNFLSKSAALLSPEDRAAFMASIREAVTKGVRWEFESRLITTAGKSMHFKGISRLRRSESELVYNGVLLDISREKQAEEELRKYRDHLEDSIRERTEDLVKACEQLNHENETRKRTENTLISREKELHDKQRNLEEMNTALKVLLNQREKDKESLEANILRNIKSAVFPFIDALKSTGLTEKQQMLLSEVDGNLRNIASSFIKELSNDYIGLSPSEIQVAALIKEGKSSKEISSLLNISLNTVLSHRYCIRKKTGLKRKKINLRAYLQTLD